LKVPVETDLHYYITHSKISGNTVWASSKETKSRCQKESSFDLLSIAASIIQLHQNTILINGLNMSREGDSHWCRFIQLQDYRGIGLQTLIHAQWYTSRKGAIGRIIGAGLPILEMTATVMAATETATAATATLATAPAETARQLRRCLRARLRPDRGVPQRPHRHPHKRIKWLSA
jgi:hypothetical protein